MNDEDSLTEFEKSSPFPIENNNNNAFGFKHNLKESGADTGMDQSATSNNIFDVLVPNTKNTNWTMFDDEEVKSHSLFSSSNGTTSVNNVIGTHQTQNKDIKNTSISGYKPAIPPRLSLGESFSTSSVPAVLNSPSPTKDIDFAVFDDFNFSSSTNDESSLLSNISTKKQKSSKQPPPPIPPRASERLKSFEMTLPPMNEHKISENETNNSETTVSDNFSWAQFDDNNTDKINDMTVEPSHSKDDVAKEFSIFGQSTIVKDETKVKSEGHTRRLSVKKPSNGYLHLMNDDDEHEPETNIPSELKTIIGSIEPHAIDHSLDCSPTKPLSKWATFSNEDDESKEEVLKTDEADMFLSVTNAIGDHEIDNEDDFSLNANRLSVDMTDLKGFNRVDKGSQNNLVDFSAMKDDVDGADGNADDIAAEDEQDTIFDLTAQGDSLKRRRPKEAKDSSSESEEVVSALPDECHVGPAAFEESPAQEDTDKSMSGLQDVPTGSFLPPLSSTSSRTNSPAVSNDSSVPAVGGVGSNPFWTDTPTSLDLQSSFGNSPFDAVIFSSQKTENPPSPVHSKTDSSCTSPAITSPLVRLPPPPVSSSRSSQRSRCRSTSSEKSTIGKSAAKKLQLEFDKEFNIFDEPQQAIPPQSLLLIEDDPVSNDSNIDKTDKNVVSAPLLEDLFEINNGSKSSSGDEINERTALSATESNLFGDSFVDSSGIKPTEPDLFADFNDSFITSNVETDKSEPQTVEDLFFASHINISSSQSDQNTTLTSPEDNDIDKLIELTKSTSVESPNSTPLESTVPLVPGVELIPKQYGWTTYMRFPREKRTMSTRKWVEIYARLNLDKIDNPMIHLLYTEKTKTPFHTISLASHHMQFTQPKLQAQYADDGQIQRKLHAVKVMVVYYREKRAFSPKRSQFAVRNASGFKHTTNSKQSVKLGFEKYINVCSFVEAIQNAMMNCHKRTVKSDEDHSPVVKYHSRDEVLINCHDKLQAVVSDTGVIEQCSVNVHMFITSFLSGDPMVRITINDKKLEGKEVVRREDIIPTSMDRWIDVSEPVLHKCCTADSYGADTDNWGTCTFYPPDACKAELMRFSTTFEDKELPVIVRSSMEIKGARLQLRSILRLSQSHEGGGFLNQVPCEDLMIRFPVPIQWSNFFRIDGRFRNHNVHAKRTARQKRPGGVTREAGISMETSVGNAKYERAYDAIVWRVAQFPEKNATENTPHVFTCTIELPSDCEFKHLCASGDVLAEDKYRWSEVEYTMPTATASHVCVRSVSLPNSDRAEKFVCYSAHYLYKVKMVVESTRVGEEGMEDKAFSLCNVQ